MYTFSTFGRSRFSQVTPPLNTDSYVRILRNAPDRFRPTMASPPSSSRLIRAVTPSRATPMHALYSLANRLLLDSEEPVAQEIGGAAVGFVWLAMASGKHSRTQLDSFVEFAAKVVNATVGPVLASEVQTFPRSKRQELWKKITFHCAELFLAHYSSAFIRCRRFCILYRQSYGRPSLKHLFKISTSVHPWIQQYQAPSWPLESPWSPRVDIPSKDTSTRDAPHNTPRRRNTRRQRSPVSGSPNPRPLKFYSVCVSPDTDLVISPTYDDEGEGSTSPIRPRRIWS